MRPLRGLQETRVATREESGVLGFPSRRGLTPRGSLECNPVQLTFLKLLSATARQSFTYTCQNSAAWLDEAAGDHSRSARFLGANGEELSFNQTAAATITVPYDGCRVRKRAGAGQIGEGSL